jgi:hypothetical protein
MKKQPEVIPAWGRLFGKLETKFWMQSGSSLNPTSQISNEKSPWSDPMSRESQDDGANRGSRQSRNQTLTSSLPAVRPQSAYSTSSIPIPSPE